MMCAVISHPIWAGWLTQSPRTPQLLNDNKTLTNLFNQNSGLLGFGQSSATHELDRYPIGNNSFFKAFFE